MSVVTLSEKGQIVIPLKIRQRYDLTAGTQVEFVDEGGSIRLVVRRRVPASDPDAGFGLIRARPGRASAGERLSSFDAAALVRKKDQA